MRILVVEDDERIAESLSEVLSDLNHVVDIAADGIMGKDFVELFPYDLILLDVMLPEMDGISLCQHLRRAGHQMPILMLTARDTSGDKVMGLDAGADDYVVKPFNLPELLARVRALLRRGNVALPPVLEWERLRLNPSRCEVSYADRELHLTPKEYALLELFMRHPGRVFSRAAILEHLWSFEEPPGEETVKVHLKDLRKKLKSVGGPPDAIETVYGLGYRLRQV